MRIAKASPSKIRHRVGFTPNNIVKDPKTQILKDVAEAENIVIATDHPDRSIIFERIAAGA